MHKCKCSPDCQAEVVTPGNLYARGHNQASHKAEDYERRGRSISKKIRAKQEAGTYVNQFEGKKHTKSSKKKMSKYHKNRPEEHQKHFEEGIHRRSKNKKWLKAVRAAAIKGGKARIGSHHTEETKKQISDALKKARYSHKWPSWNKGLRGCSGQVAWNKGLTKEDHPGLQKLSEAIKSQYASGQKKTQSRRDWQVEYESRHNGKLTLKSGLEMYFAIQLDNRNIRWAYEEHRFKVTMGRIGEYENYTPDFYLPKQDLFVELKGIKAPKQTMRKYQNFVAQHKKNWVILYREDVDRFLKRLK